MATLRAAMMLKLAACAAGPARDRGDAPPPNAATIAVSASVGSGGRSAGRGRGAARTCPSSRPAGRAAAGWWVRPGRVVGGSGLGLGVEGVANCQYTSDGAWQQCCIPSLKKGIFFHD